MISSLDEGEAAARYLVDIAEVTRQHCEWVVPRGSV